MVARLVAVVEQGALFAFELGGGAHADAGGIEAAARRVGEERILLVELRELLFHHAADEHDGQHPLARFVSAHHVDHVAAAVLEAQRLEAEHAFDGAPVVLDADLARGIEGGGGFGERFVEEIERGGLAAPLERELMGGGLGGRRGAEEIAQGGEARRPVLGSEREGAPLFERGERIQLVEQALGAGARLAFLAEQQRAQLAEAGVGDLLAHVEIEAVRHGRNRRSAG